MCLSNIKTLKPRIATKDIIVYKKGYFYNCYLQTPYQRAKYFWGRTKKSSLVVNNSGDIHKGLHSYKFKRDAGIWHTRAIIPKGARYFIGDFNGSPSIASSRLLVPKPKNLKTLMR